MYSIKPGRAPSAMQAVAGVIVILFGIGWTTLAYFMTHASRATNPAAGDSPAGIFLTIAGIIFPLFGLCVVVMGIINVVYSLKNAFSKNRTSLVDIETGSGESIFPNKTTESRLRDLEELKSKGVLTLKEYTDQRARILNSL